MKNNVENITNSANYLNRDNQSKNRNEIYISNKTKIIGGVAIASLILGGIGIYQEAGARHNQALASEKGATFEIDKDEALVIYEGALIRPDNDARKLNYEIEVMTQQVENDIILEDIEDIDFREKIGKGALTGSDITFIEMPTELVEDYVDTTGYGNKAYVHLSNETIEVVNVEDLAK